jgi:hypothetical protein
VVLPDAATVFGGHDHVMRQTVIKVLGETS